MRLEPGQPIDRYVVEGRIGDGGMAVVYRVRHASLGTLHALKILHVESAGMRQRLLREGRLQAVLRHPNIVAVSDVLEVDGAPALLMEYVEGPTLRALLAARRLPIDDALAVFRGITAAVAHAHHAGLIHRDLKPENVLLSVQHGRVVPKVTDFGIVKAEAGDVHTLRTGTGTALGTPAFMSPEQINDASTVDRRADLWSLGCILYDLVCGQLPFKADDVIALLMRIAVGRYIDPRALAPEIPERVAIAIEGMLQSNPEDRISDCAELLRYLDGERDAPTIHGAPLGALPPPAEAPADLQRTSFPASAELAALARSLAPVAGPSRIESATYEGGAFVPVTREPLPAPARSLPTVDLAELPPPPARRSARVAALGIALVLAAGAAAVLALQAGAPPASPPPPAGPAPAPSVAAPASVPPSPEPVAPAAPAPGPTGVVAAPRPARPAPVTAVAPAPPVVAPTPTATTAFTFEGAQTLWLINKADGGVARGRAAPGEYRVRAVFHGNSSDVGAGSIVVGDAPLHLKCSPQMQRCSP